jgi:hypothetical protein
MIDLEKNLQRYIPELFKLMEGQKISWSKINKDYDQLEKKRQIEYDKNGGHLMTEPNFYDMVRRSVQRDPNFVRPFEYTKIVLDNLDKNLSREERIWVGSILRNLLKTLTIDHLHFLGELFVLNNIISRRHLYYLKMTEHEMDNGKRIDFNIVFKNSGREGLMEVMNIHLKGLDLSNHTRVRKHFERKIEDKIKDKTRDVDSDFIFQIQPVIWGSSDQLRVVGDFFKYGFGCKIENVNEPLSFCCHTLVRDGQNKFLYVFDEISKVFNMDILLS